MDILYIIGTVVGVIIIASLVGLAVRRFRLKVWQLVLIEVLGFVLLILGQGSNTGVLMSGIVLLTFGSAGLFYMWFLGGAKKQQAAHERHDEGGEQAHTQADASDKGVPDNEVNLLTFIKEHDGCKIADIEPVLGEALPQILPYQLNDMLKALKKKSLIETDRDLARFGVNKEVGIKITSEGEAFLRSESPQ